MPVSAASQVSRIPETWKKWVRQALSLFDTKADVGGDSFTGLVKLKSAEGLTAHAGGGQGSATALTGQVNRVTTVGTSGDSVGLPAAAAGLQVTAINAGANSMNVFPASGDQINALGVNAAFAQGAGKVAIFASTVAGQWHALLSA